MTFSCDPAAIRTQDPQLRRLLLYPAELPDLPHSFLRHQNIDFTKISAKVTHLAQSSKKYNQLFWIEDLGRVQQQVQNWQKCIKNLL